MADIALRSLPRVMKSVVINDATGTLEAVAAVASQQVRVWGWVLTLASAATVTFKSGSTVLTGPMSLTAWNPLPPTGPPNIACAYPLFETVAGQAFNIVLGAAVQLSGTLYYTQD